jgi:hypothetical protein
MPCPQIIFEKSSTPGSLGEGVTATFRLHEGQAVSFVLRDAEDHSPELVDTALVNEMQTSTHKYWARWISGGKYIGRWEQPITRSLLLLKMLTFEPSGAIVAAPTFSLPEDIGGTFRTCIVPRLADKIQAAEIGIIVTRGCEMRRSPSISCSGWASAMRRKPT